MKGLISNTYLIIEQQIYDLITIFGPPCFIFFINNDLFDSGLLVMVSKLFLFLTWCVLFLTVIVRFRFLSGWTWRQLSLLLFMTAVGS